MKYTVKKLQPEETIDFYRMGDGTITVKTPNHVTFAVEDENGNIYKSKGGWNGAAIFNQKRVAQKEADFLNKGESGEC